MELEYLCDMEFRYDDAGLVQLSPYGGREGQGFGGGTGVVTGERMSGRFRWSNAPRRREDGILLPDVRGLIETDDGAPIFFTTRGYSRPRESATSRWYVAAVTFSTEDDRYRWLNAAFCVQEGPVELTSGVVRAGTYLLKSSLS